MAIKKGDFVEVEYTGIMKEENIVFDTTDKAVATDSGIDNPKMEFGPVVVCIGEGHLLKGLEDELVGKEIGKDLTIELGPEQGFGKKDAKYIKMFPFSAFKKQGINPQPGLQVNIDGAIGIIKTASGGRCLVDFNHPLSGRDIIYKVKVLKIIEDDAKKLKSFLKLALNTEPELTIKEGVAEIKAKQEMPKEIVETLEKKVKEVIPSIKKLKFVVEKAPEKK